MSKHRNFHVAWIWNCVRIHKGGHTFYFYGKFIDLILFKAHFIKFQVILMNISLLHAHHKCAVRTEHTHTNRFTIWKTNDIQQLRYRFCNLKYTLSKDLLQAK